MAGRKDHPKLVRVADGTERFKNIYEIRLAPTPPNSNSINSDPHHTTPDERIGSRDSSKFEGGQTWQRQGRQSDGLPESKSTAQFTFEAAPSVRLPPDRHEQT